MGYAPDTIGIRDVPPGRQPGAIGWLMLSPLVAWLALFVVAPSFILLFYSFCTRGEFQGQVEYTFTWENYTRAFDGAVMWQIIRGAGPEILLTGPVVVGIILLLNWVMIRDGRSLVVGAMLIGLSLALAVVRGEWECWLICLAGSVVGVAVLSIFPDFREWVRERAVRMCLWAILGVVVFWIDRLTLESDATYLRIFVRSINYAAITTVICLLVGYPVAYFIGKSSPKWRNLLLVAVMIPFWTSFLIRTYAWILILNQKGLLNSLLIASGLIKEPLDMMYTPLAVVIGLVYAYLPFMILPIFGSVEKLDESVIEASLNLGATPLRTFIRVIFPLTRPGVIAGALMVFVPAVGMFAVTDLMSGGKIPLIGSVISNQFGQAGDWPFGSALGLALLVMFAAAYYVGSRRGPITAQ